MHLVTSRFGPIDIEEDALITFTHPIIGFPALRRFVLLPGPAGGGVKWLQSTESGDIAFLLMNPFLVRPDYEITLGHMELAEMGVEDIHNLDIYTLLVVPSDRTQIRTNLKAPILVNPVLRLGKQTILENSGYPIQYFLTQQASPEKPQETPKPEQDTEEPKEAAHAGTDA